MAVHKVSLMEAYQIETLRSNGVSNEEILTQLKQGNIEPWKALHEDFDFEVLRKLANEDLGKFQEILSKGYQVKFVTYNGLKNLLRLRFGKVQGEDYTSLEKGITNLVLEEEQLSILKQMLSGNWVLEEQDRDNNIVVEIKLA